MSAGGSNQYDQFIYRSSNQFNGDHDQNVVMLRLGARLLWLLISAAGRHRRSR